MRWWLNSKQGSVKFNEVNSEEDLSYGIESNGTKPRIMSLANIFAWWCHPITDQVILKHRLEQTKLSLSMIKEIADCQIYRKIAPDDQLKRLIVLRMVEIVIEIDDQALLQRKLKHLPESSQEYLMIKIRLKELAGFMNQII